MKKFEGKINKYEKPTPFNKIEKQLDYGFIQDTIKHLYDELKTSINSNTPFFIFSQKRQNEKMSLNNEKQLLIYNQIKNLESIANEFLALKAQAIFSSEYLKNLVEEKYELARQYFERMKEEHLTKIKIQQANRLHVDYDLSDRQILQKKELAMIRKLNGEAERTEEINDLLKILKTKIKSENLPPVFYIHLLSLYLNSDGSQISQMDVMEKMKDLLVKQAGVQVDKAMAEVDAILKDNEMKNLKNNLAKKDAGL